MNKFIYLLVLLLVFSLLPNHFYCKAEEIPVYHIDPFSLENYDTVKKGTQFDVSLKNNVSTNENENTNGISFIIPAFENTDLKGHGLITMCNSGKRLSRHSNLELAVNMLTLPDGQEVNVSSSSLSYSSLNPPHVSSKAAALARTVSSFALASSPATLGIGLGASFLINGLLSAKQNGAGDFVWGGLSGSGFSFAEKLLRKQPDVKLEAGTTVPMVLTEDLKVSKGIKKENMEEVNVSKEEAIARIEKLIQWGDLTGALEYSIKSGQKEVYDELISKISS
jgi:hypothetical protein